MFRALLFAIIVTLPVQGAPDVPEILRKLAENAAQTEAARNAYAYQRISRVEYLDGEGSVKKDTIRVYEILPEDGEPVTRLVKVDGRAPSGKEEKQRSAARQTGENGRGLSLSEDLLSRFDFRFVREDHLGSRPAWVLAFAARSDAPTEGFMDKFINAMTGFLWVDQEDYQMAKVDVRLSQRVSFFGGIAGAIEKMDLTIFQRRIEPGVWLGEATHIDFEGRKLFSTVRFRCFENCSDYRRVLQHAATN